MRGSLYRRLTLCFIAVLLVTMVVLSTVLTIQFQRDLVSREAASVGRNYAPIAQLIRRYELGRLSATDFRTQMVRVEQQLGVGVGVATADGEVIFLGTGITKAVLQHAASSVDSLGSFIQSGTGRRGTYTQTVTANAIIFEAPIALNNTPGVVLIRASLQTGKLYAQAFRSVAVSAAIATAIAALVMYVLSRYLTRPLKDLTQAVEGITQGNLRRRVRVTTEDEIGHLAGAFNNMMDRLESLEGVRRDFIASVSHELRSPLTAIRGFVQGMVDDVIPDQDKAHYLDLTLKETQRLNRLIDQLIDSARLDSGQFALSLERVDLVPVFRQAVASMEPTLNQKRQTLVTHWHVNKVVATADPDRVAQIAINLVSNASRYTAEQGRIEVSLAREGDEVVFTVTDNGCGISKEDLPHIWDRFFKADRSRTDKSVGSGLGLSIVKSLVEAHGGTVSAQSRENVGSTFHIRLPLEPSAVGHHGRSQGSMPRSFGNREENDSR